MICESDNHHSKTATLLKIRSKGEPSKKPAFAPRVLKKVTPVNLRSNPTLGNDHLFTAIVAPAGLKKNSSLPLG